MMRWVTLLCVSFAGLSGCAAIDDYHYSWANHRRAQLAWKRNNTWRDRVSSHFVAGWKQGYFDVCTGGSGEPPAVPPSKYWSPHYQGEHGQVAIEDWYVGYQEGATEAQSTGVNEWHPIYTGPTVPVSPVGWPVVEMFPTQMLPAEAQQVIPEPTKPPVPAPGTPQQKISATDTVRPAAPAEITRQPVPNELDVFPHLDSSHRLPLPTEEASVLSGTEESPALPVSPSPKASQPSQTTSPTPTTDESNLVPPVFTDE